MYPDEPWKPKAEVSKTSRDSEDEDELVNSGEVDLVLSRLARDSYARFCRREEVVSVATILFATSLVGAAFFGMTDWRGPLRVGSMIPLLTWTVYLYAEVMLGMRRRMNLKRMRAEADMGVIYVYAP